MKRTGALTVDTPGSSLIPSVMGGYRENIDTYEPGSSLSPGTESSTSRMRRNKFLLTLSFPVCGSFVIAA